MTGNICIMCEKDKAGIRIKDDATLRTLKWIKYELLKRPRRHSGPVVCRECYSAYSKKRKSFERKQIIYSIIGVVFAIALVVATGGRKPGAYAFGVLVVVFMLGLAHLNYIPELEMPSAPSGQGPRRRRPVGDSAAKRR